MGDIRGRIFVLTGWFETMTRAVARRQLTQAGGVVARSVSNRTDALFAGSDSGNAEFHQAKIRGVPILDETALVAVLEGGDLDALIDQERPAPTPTLPDDALARFTVLDLTTPTKARWEQITTLLDQCGPELAEVAVDYLTEATEHWEHALDLRMDSRFQPIQAGTAPRAWVEAILRGEDHPKHRLVRALDLAGLQLTGKVASHLFACPHLANLRLLRLDDNPKLPAAFFKKLANAPLFANLTHLSLADTRLNKGHVAALANATHLRNLTHLSLDSTHFDSAESLATLLAAPTWAKLQHLDYSHTCIDDDVDYTGLAALAANPAVAALRSLRWAPCKDAHVLATLARKHAATLERLWLDSGYDVDIVPALTTATFERLTHLSIHYTTLGNSGVAALAQHPALQRLDALSLVHVGCDDEGAEALADPRAPATAGLRSLNLSCNDLSDGALARLLSSPQLRDIVELGLARTGFGPASAEVLCNAPLAALQLLDLHETRITEADLVRLTTPGALPALKGLATDLDLPAEGWSRFGRRG